MDVLLSVVQTVNAYLSDYILLVLLVGAGLYFSIRTRFVQVRCFGEGMKTVFGGLGSKKDGKSGGLSSFQALATAIAAQVGTGNIVGACGAILIGGPGAIFWMWVIAFFGMATIYAEAVLAQKTRKVNEDGSVEGGPAYYIKHKFKGRLGTVMAIFFAVATVLALGFMGAMVQSNAIGESMQNAFGVPSFAIGIVLALVVGLILIGGVERIGKVCEKLVPIMAGLYLVGCLVVLAFRAPQLPETIGMIFGYAFVPNAILGGGIGYALKQAISQGVKRGLFSNEAGMGSTPHAHALANVKKPHEQGVSAMIGVFIDTFVVLTATALVVISTLYAGGGPLADGVEEGFVKTNLAQLAFSSVFGEWFGNIFVAVCLLFFAFSTIIGWNLFARINVVYLFGKKANLPFSILALIFVFLGSILSNDLVWELTDTFNQLMVIPNIIAIVALGGVVVSELNQRKRSSAPSVEGSLVNESAVDEEE